MSQFWYDFANDLGASLGFFLILKESRFEWAWPSRPLLEVDTSDTIFRSPFDEDFQLPKPFDFEKALFVLFFTHNSNILASEVISSSS